MLKFRPITINEIDLINRLLKKQDSRICEYNFGNLYFYQKYYNTQFVQYNDSVIFKFEKDGDERFFFPDAGDISAVDLIMEYAHEKNKKAILRAVEEDTICKIKDKYGSKYSYELNDDESDYLYLASKLSTYSGKALHGQKNFCNHFEKTHNWEFVPLTSELIPACVNMLNSWYEDNKQRLDASAALEYDVSLLAFSQYELLNLEGGCLLSDGKLIGYSIGEMCSKDTFNAHFEKAIIEIKGSYEMVCREMTKMVLQNHPEVIYINRENDLGIPRLRQAKMELKPEMILNIYTALEQ